MPAQDSSVRPGQTSEGIKGEMVEPMPDGRILTARVSNQRGWQVAPGVHYKRWDQTDSRGRIRAHLLSVDWDRPGVSIDYESGRHVPDTNPLGRLLAQDNAVAGVNGGFFDIHDTGAPLGVGSDRQRGFLHAARYTWNYAFYFTRKGAPRIGQLKLDRDRRPVPPDVDHQRELTPGPGRQHRRLRARLGLDVRLPHHRRADEGAADGGDPRRPGDRQPDLPERRQADRRHGPDRPRAGRRRAEADAGRLDRHRALGPGRSAAVRDQRREGAAPQPRDPGRERQRAAPPHRRRDRPRRRPDPAARGRRPVQPEPRLHAGRGGPAAQEARGRGRR